MGYSSDKLEEESFNKINYQTDFNKKDTIKNLKSNESLNLQSDSQMNKMTNKNIADDPFQNFDEQNDNKITTKNMDLGMTTNDFYKIKNKNEMPKNLEENFLEENDKVNYENFDQTWDD